MIERYVSVDVETSGPIIGRHSLLALGACFCDDFGQKFGRSVQPISTEFVPEAMEIVGRPLEAFESEGQPPQEVFGAFARWVLESCSGATPVFVGFNAAFDWGFVNWYFLMFCGSNPFGVAPLDIKAYYAGFAGADWEATRSSRLPERFKGPAPHSHDALEDAIEQANIFNRIRAEAQSRR
jgi:ribonuclease T